MAGWKSLPTPFVSASLFLLVAWPAFAVDVVMKELPENLAPKAKITASSEHSDPYKAENVADGEIPDTGSRADQGHAWCVRGRAVGNRGELTLTWAKPVEIAELLLFARTSYGMECFKDYEVVVDGGSEVVVSGSLHRTDMPQQIRFPKVRKLRSLTLRFLSSHPARNPGLSELMVFSEPAKEETLLRALGIAEEYPGWMPDSLGAILVIQRNELNPSHVYTYHAEGYRPGGALYLCRLTPDGPKLTKLVDSSAGQILDCALSYDGREVLFSWKKGAREYQAQFDRSLAPDENPDHMYKIYRMNVDGTGLTCLTDGTCNNFNPCWLPDGDIAFLSDRKSAFAYCFTTTSPVLYRMDRDGNNVKRLSANYLNDFTPSVDAEGRILFTRWEYVDRPAIPIQSLWSINPDGTGLSGVFGNRVITPATFMEAKNVPGTNKLLCVFTSHGGPCRGAIGIVDRQFGPNSQKGIRNLTPEINIDLIDHGNGNNVRRPYEDPLPIDQQFFLVSKRGAVRPSLATTIARAAAGSILAISTPFSLTWPVGGAIHATQTASHESTTRGSSSRTIIRFCLHLLPSRRAGRNHAGRPCSPRKTTPTIGGLSRPSSRSTSRWSGARGWTCRGRTVLVI